MMHLVAGLGNPGAEYDGTRHNAGFLVADALAEQMGVRYWKSECGAAVAHTVFAGEDLLVAKPQSFMNTSGGPISQLMKKYGISPADLIVVHDELDIDPGTIRVKFGGGHAGHNGLRSICDKLGTRDWTRVRIGIGRPPGRMPVADFVLSQPRGEALEEFEEAVERGTAAVVSLLEYGLAKTQQEFN